MRLLLDTHTFLWWVHDGAQLSKRARAAVADPRNDCFLSLVSCWEMAIKVSLGKLKLPGTIDRFVPEHLTINSFLQLEIKFRHITRLAALQHHHRDPFDRLLVAQAVEERLTLVSADPIFRKYGVKLLW